MSSIEELRRERERLDKEREEIERKLAEAERQEREQAAGTLVKELVEKTAAIDRLKEERQALLMRIREAAPRIGDFTYAQDDWKMSLPAARAPMKQPDLFDRVIAALAAHDLHLEPHQPRFRVFRGLRPVGTLQFAPKRIVFVVGEPILDATILADARKLDAAYPGLARLHLSSETKVRKLKPGLPGAPDDGDFATSLQLAANDTGSLDTVLPLALRSFDHVAAYWEQWTPDTDRLLFEPWPDAPAQPPPANDAKAAPDATPAEAEKAE